MSTRRHCTFPHCWDAPTTLNRIGQPMCDRHHTVVVGESGVPDRHDKSSGGEG